MQPRRLLRGSIARAVDPSAIPAESRERVVFYELFVRAVTRAIPAFASILAARTDPPTLGAGPLGSALHIGRSRRVRDACASVVLEVLNVKPLGIHMFGLTQLGVIHTAISLVAVGAGIVALLRDGLITSRNGIGTVYVIATVLTCFTGFGIFQHGGFGKAHLLGVVTLIVLGVAAVAEYTRAFGRVGIHVATLSYSATFLFHWIPAITEATTRLPPGRPLLPDADAPELQIATGVLVVVFLLGASVQLRLLRAVR